MVGSACVEIQFHSLASNNPLSQALRPSAASRTSDELVSLVFTNQLLVSPCPATTATAWSFHSQISKISSRVHSCPGFSCILRSILRSGLSKESASMIHRDNSCPSILWSLKVFLWCFCANLISPIILLHPRGMSSMQGK